MKQKELLRSYKFREYLTYLDTNRREFAKMADHEKTKILIGYKNVMGKR